MAILPIFYKANKTDSFVVVGGAEDACRKVRLLLGLDIPVVVINDVFNGEIQKYIDSKQVKAKNKMIDSDDVSGASLVFGASEDDDINKNVSAWARDKKIPVNIVDKPDLSDFIMGGIVNRSPLIVSVCSNGYAPIMVRNIRILIETLLDKNLGKLALFAQKFRETVGLKFTSFAKRKKFWQRFFNGTISTDFLEGRQYDAWKSTLCLLNENENPKDNIQQTYTIDLAFNNSDCLTLGDIRELQLADIIVYDYGLEKQIFEYFRRDAVRIDSVDVDNITDKQNQKICYVKYQKLKGRKII